MPRTPNWILNSSVYIYPGKDDAIFGRPMGGVGLLVSVPNKIQSNPNNNHHLFVVTCRHLADALDSPVIRYNSTNGRFNVYSPEPRDWVHSNTDDLSI